MHALRAQRCIAKSRWSSLTDESLQLCSATLIAGYRQPSESMQLSVAEFMGELRVIACCLLLRHITDRVGFRVRSGGAVEGTRDVTSSLQQRNRVHSDRGSRVLR